MTAEQLLPELVRPWRDNRSADALVVITAPHFVAGLVAREGAVIQAAPILAYMQGWDGRQVAAYCQTRGWTWARVESPDTSERNETR